VSKIDGIDVKILRKSVDLLKIHPKNRMVGGMGTMFFTSGQAARQLAVSQDAIRSLLRRSSASSAMGRRR
jgi:hypothetical protein